MRVAAVTITYNRLELTKSTLESFYAKTNVDRHVFVDNGSTDGTQEYLRSRYEHIFLDSNHGITDAFVMAASQLKDYDFILKLDNDIETVTDDIINKMLKFYELNGLGFVCSPIDLNLDRNYKPKSFGYGFLNGYKVDFVTHTGGAFQLIPNEICQRLIDEYQSFKLGDQAIGNYYIGQGYKPVYLMDLQMKHIGINQTSSNYVL
jgi:GT2 family glycosyltransferase